MKGDVFDISANGGSTQFEDTNQFDLDMKLFDKTLLVTDFTSRISQIFIDSRNTELESQEIEEKYTEIQLSDVRLFPNSPTLDITIPAGLKLSEDDFISLTGFIPKSIHGTVWFKLIPSIDIAQNITTIRITDLDNVGVSELL